MGNERGIGLVSDPFLQLPGKIKRRNRLLEIAKMVKAMLLTEVLTKLSLWLKNRTACDKSGNVLNFL